MKTKFAENFTAILKIRDITQSQFARLYGVKANTVNQWANGKREPTFHDLLCIATLLDIEIKELLGFTPRTRNAILRDIIGNNADFRKEQNFLEAQMRKDGKSVEEITSACSILFDNKYKEYKEIFGFLD